MFQLSDHIKSCHDRNSNILFHFRNKDVEEQVSLFNLINFTHTRCDGNKIILILKGVLGTLLVSFIV